MRRVLLLLALLPACSKPTAEGTGAATTSAAATTTAAGFDIEGFCEQVMALPSGRECEGQDEFAEGNKVGFCGTMLRASRDSGRIRFDATAAKRCTAAVDKARASLPDKRYLSDIAAAFADCDDVVSGRQQVGSPCDYGMECGEGLSCLDKKCRKRSAAGEPCQQLESDRSLVSSRSSCAAGHTCDQGKCKARIPAGAACEHSDACSSGLRCRAGKCAEAPPLKAGEGCGASDDCTAGLYCPAGEPRRCTSRKKAGDACGSDDECLGRCSRKAGGKCVSYCGSG